MAHRGGELPRQRQAEAEFVRSGGVGGIPPGMPRLRRALDQRAARRVRAPRRRRRLGAPLYHHGFFRRSADRARIDEIRRQRHALPRLEAGDVVGGGEDRARRSGGRVRGLHVRYGVGEVSDRQCDRRIARPSRVVDRHLDHDALDAAGQPRDQFLAEDRIRTVSSRRRADRQLGKVRRSVRHRRQTGGRGVPASARHRIQEAQASQGIVERAGLLASSQGIGRRLRIRGAAASWRSRHRGCRHRLRPHRARARPRGFRSLDRACPRACRTRHQHRDSLHRRCRRPLHRPGAGIYRQARADRDGRERRCQRGGDQGFGRRRHADLARPAQASISAFVAVEKAGDLPQHAAMVHRDGQPHRLRPGQVRG